MSCGASDEKMVFAKNEIFVRLRVKKCEQIILYMHGQRFPHTQTMKLHGLKKFKSNIYRTFFIPFNNPKFEPSISLAKKRVLNLGDGLKPKGRNRGVCLVGENIGLVSSKGSAGLRKKKNK
jgi:hypothetical protein